MFTLLNCTLIRCNVLFTHRPADLPSRLIAMGYPSDGAEAVYRNRYEDVYRFVAVCGLPFRVRVEIVQQNGTTLL